VADFPKSGHNFDFIINTVTEKLILGTLFAKEFPMQSPAYAIVYGSINIYGFWPKESF